MCPLFASGGSPWTGEVNAPCPHDPNACGFFGSHGHCDGALYARQQVLEARDGLPVIQLGACPREGRRTPTEFDCPRAGECQWQIDSGEALCPPRLALSLGLDPRNCAW